MIKLHTAVTADTEKSPETVRDRQTTEVTLTLRGEFGAVDRVLGLLSMLVLNGNWGHSNVFGVGWDGDGHDKLEIDGLDTAPYKDIVERLGSYGGDVEIYSTRRSGSILHSKGSSSISTDDD
jgi:hypothetical protein